MKSNMKLFLSLFFILLTIFTYPGKALASDNFSTSYNVNYQVLDDESTRVSMQVELKNDTSEFYASSYTIQTGFREITDVRASDSLGTMETDVKKNNEGTIISFDFNSNVVGINKSQRFNVSFSTKEITKNYGNIWEVNIPGVSNQDEYESFNVSVNVPASFRKPEIIKPSVGNISSVSSTLRFNKNDLGNSGISIAYGEVQVYQFDLDYHLQNKNLYPVNTEIALPSNNNYQEVKIDSINPKPEDVYIDNDGNWLAKYKLLPSQKLDIKVLGSARVSYKPRVETLPEQQREIYLQSKKYWEADDPQIKKLASELKTPRAIYDYVVKTLNYDSSRVKEVQVRAGGASVLDNPESAVCLEFTDLFISLARAAGIPARAVEGYANTSNSARRPLSLLKDVLHSWPQYYDDEKQAWIMVDPTWQNTTGGIDYFNVFDFDHFAFVIKGEDSDYPVPAGGYKLTGRKSTQDINITTTKAFEKSSPSLVASTNFNQSYFAGLPMKGEIVVYNDSGVLAPNQTVEVTSDKLGPSPQNLYVDKIPPYGKRVVPIQFNSKPILTNETDEIKISIGGHTFVKGVSISPFYKHKLFYILGGIILGSIIGFLFIFAYKRRRVPVYR